MSIDRIPSEIRCSDYYQHIDPGFVNHRLCLSNLPPDVRSNYVAQMQSEPGHQSVRANDQLLVEAILDMCDVLGVPTLLEALERGTFPQIFRSTERLEPCPEIDTATRVSHGVVLDLVFEKPVVIAYHNRHIVSDTGKLSLKEGVNSKYIHSIVGLLHDRGNRFEIEPLVIGHPTLNHSRNGGDESGLVIGTPSLNSLDNKSRWLMVMGPHEGELLPEDIDQFAKMKDVTVSTAEEWMSVMENLPEAKVKTAVAYLLAEPAKKDWGGEFNDHFSGNVSLKSRRQKAAFLLKGPGNAFREMTLDMCGKRADQIYRLTKSVADILVVQHAHLIGEAVRETLRSMAVHPGRHRKYCFIDGQQTYRILKAYNLLDNCLNISR